MNARTQWRKSLRYEAVAWGLFALAAACSGDDPGVTFANCPSVVTTGVTSTGAVSQAPSLQGGAGGARVERPGDIRIFQQVPAVIDAGTPVPTTTGMGPDARNPCLSGEGPNGAEPSH